MLCSSRNLSNTSSQQTATQQGTDQATPNTQVKRDALGGFSVVSLAASAIESNGATLNIATTNTTQTVNLGSGTGVQTINIGNGGAGQTSINIGGDGDFVNIAGTLNTINTTNTQVKDKSLVLNAGGLAASAGSSGIYFEEAGDSSTAFMTISPDRSKLEMKAPTGSLITLDQSLATGDSPSFQTLALRGASQQLKVFPVANNGESSLVFNTQINGTGNAWIIGQGSWTTGVGNLGLGSLTAGLILKLDGTTGKMSTPSIAVANTIAFPSAVVRKRISVYDIGDPTSLTDHRFSGFGITNNTLVYQTNNVLDSHVFFTATSATASNELFRIGGSGAVSCPGSFNVGGVCSLNAGVTVTGSASVQYGVTCGSVVTGSVSSTALTASTSVTTPSLIFPSGTLSYYSEVDITTTFTSPFTTGPTLQMKLTRIGRVVSMVMMQDYLTTQVVTGSVIITANSAIPVDFRPGVIRAHGIHPGYNNGVFLPCNHYMSSSGLLVIAGGDDADVFSGSGGTKNGWYNFSMTWTV